MPDAESRLLACRADMDAVDAELIRLFRKRMQIAAEVAACKRLSGRPVYDPVREEEKLTALENASPADLRPYIRPLYTTLFSLSRQYQNTLLHRKDGSQD